MTTEKTGVKKERKNGRKGEESSQNGLKSRIGARGYHPASFETQIEE
jgi:hypothetical protein